MPVVDTDVAEPKATTLSKPVQFHEQPIWKCIDEVQIGDVLKEGIEQDYQVNAQPVSFTLF